MPVELQSWVMLILSAVITTALPILAYKVWTWIGAHKEQVLASLSASQLATLQWIVTLAVQSAQQSGVAGLIANVGAVKKAAAIQFVQNMLDQLGLPEVNVAVIEGLIESSVNQGIHLPATKTTTESSDPPKETETTVEPAAPAGAPSGTES